MISDHVDVAHTHHETVITINKRGPGCAIAEALVGHVNAMVSDDPETDDPFDSPPNDDTTGSYPVALSTAEVERLAQGADLVVDVPPEYVAAAGTNGHLRVSLTVNDEVATKSK